MIAKERHAQPRTANTRLLCAFSMQKLAGTENAVAITPPPSCAEAFCVRNYPPKPKTHEFCPQKDIIHEFYEVKLGKQGFALRNKYEFGATNSLPATNKYEFGAQDSFPATDEHEFDATNSFTALDKHKFGAQEDIIHEFYEVKLGKQGFALRHKYEFGATNSFTALKDYKFGAQNSFTAASTGSVAICEFYEVKLVSSPKGLRLEPVEITHTATTTAHAAAQKHITGAFL